MTLKEKLLKLKNSIEKTGLEIVSMFSNFIVLQFASLFITFHMVKALKKIDPNLSFFQKISQTFQTIFSKQEILSSKWWLIDLNVVFALLALASFILTCYCIYNGIFDKNNKINEKISRSLQYILFASLPFLLIIPIGFVNPDLMKFGAIAFAFFAFSKIIMENIMIGFDFSKIDLGENELLNSYYKIDKIKNLKITEDKATTTRPATKTEKLKAIFFEVILCFPSFAVKFLIETISNLIGKGTGFVIDGISKVCCGKKSGLPA